VPSPLGTAGSAHLQGIDFAGKTGSAQTVSNALKAKTANGKSKYKDNAWFVGVTPRRNPEIVVAVLFEGGEHGQFAARIAAQVVKAYVEKQRRQPTKVAQGDKKVEIGAVWNSDSPDGEDEDTLHGGRFVLDVPKTRLPLAVAAPGVQ
jgi:penicillin-binding protein 2